MKKKDCSPADAEENPHLGEEPARISFSQPYEIRSGKWAQGLTPQEGRFLWAAMAHRVLTPEILMEVLWPDPDEMPETWHDIIRQVGLLLNKKARRFGVAVENVWGQGYVLQIDDRRCRVEAA